MRQRSLWPAAEGSRTLPDAPPGRPRGRYQVSDSMEKIAVLLPNHLGDVVMATPALRALRAGRPQARISGVVRAAMGEVLRGCPWLDEQIEHDVYASAGTLARAGRRLRLARRLRESDCVVVFPNSLSSALLAWATRAPRRLGYARRGRAPLFTDTVAAPREGARFRPVAMERYYLDLVAALGCPAQGSDVELFADPESERACAALLAQHGIRGDRPLVCLAPGAAFGPSKLWPIPYLAKVAAALRDDGADVALIQAPSEQALADEVVERAGGGLCDLGAGGLSLAVLKSVVSRARLVICNDAGARHVAAAFRVPTLVLMGPTSLAYTNLNLRYTRVLREDVDCAPCQKKVCPIDHRCMTRLAPERVLEQARAALSEPDWVGSVELELAQ